MVNPVEILKDGAHIQVFQNSTQKTQTVIDITPRTANPKESEDDVK